MKFKYVSTFLLLTLSLVAKGQFEKYLVGYYPFENGKARDYATRGGEGRIYGNLQTVNGVVGEALRFDGGNHNIVFEGNVNRYLRGTRDFTISFYFKSDDLRQRSSLMGKRARCDGRSMFDLRFSTGKLRAELYERTRPRIRNNISTLVEDTEWHHYAYVRRGNTTRIYVDGLMVDKRQIPHIIPINDAAYFAINASPCKGRDGTGNLRGTIDELKIFKVALSGRDVNVLFRATTSTSQDSYRGNQRRGSREAQPQARQRGLNGRRRPNSSVRRDPRLNAIFGKYQDRDSQSELVLDPRRFVLTIKNPEGYRAKELIYTGNYKIEGGELVLLRGEVALISRSGATDQKVAYDQKIIGELYQDGVDLYIFETRMKLKK
ncbi:MAG: LamG domain-containing protein [Bacteroidota bacterium]